MGTQPKDLVSFGSRYVFPGSDRYAEQTVTLTASPGPSLAMKFGAVAIADPWWPEAAPQYPVIGIGRGAYPTMLTTVARTRDGRTEPERMAVAASIGDLDEVTAWQPLVQAEAHFHLDVDSALGAFYEITDAALLQPLFEDAGHMKGIFDRTLTELVVPLEVDGRVVAVVFLCPDGSGLYPAWAGFDKDMQAVAVLVDLKLLSAAERRVG